MEFLKHASLSGNVLTHLLLPSQKCSFFLFLEIVLFIVVTYLHWLTTQIGEYLYQAICLHWMHTQSGESGEYLY